MGFNSGFKGLSSPSNSATCFEPTEFLSDNIVVYKVLVKLNN